MGGAGEYSPRPHMVTHAFKSLLSAEQRDALRPIYYKVLGLRHLPGQAWSALRVRFHELRTRFGAGCATSKMRLDAVLSQRRSIEARIAERRTELVARFQHDVIVPGRLHVARAMALVLSLPVWKFLPSRLALFDRALKALWSIHDETIKTSHGIDTDVALGRRIYGNDARLTNNALGHVAMARARSCARWTSRAGDEVRAQAAELRDRGHVTLRGAIPAELLREVHAQFRERIEDDRAAWQVCDGKRSIVYASQAMPVVGGLMTEPIRRVIEEYYAAHFNVYETLFYRTRHLPRERLAAGEAFSNKWHCDRNPVEILSVFTLLADTTEDDGPFHVHTTQRTRELMERGFHDRLDPRLPAEELDDRVTRLTGPAGTTMIWRIGCCLHRAGEPAPGKSRDMSQFLVAPATEPLAANWLERIEPTVAEKRFLAPAAREG
jgi:hypothetical protein